jgi:hypothetical protein
MTQNDVLHIFLEGAGIETDTEDSIAIGYLFPYSAPAGVDAVMEKYTRYIDALLPVVGSMQRVQLVIRRGFTFSEYQVLFDSTIREPCFGAYPVFRSLCITTEPERRRIAFTLSKDSYEDYMTVLLKALTPFPSLLVNFFFGGCCYGKNIGYKACEKPCPHLW